MIAVSAVLPLYLPFLSHVALSVPCSSFLLTSQFSHHFEVSLMQLGLLNSGEEREGEGRGGEERRGIMEMGLVTGKSKKL